MISPRFTKKRYRPLLLTKVNYQSDPRYAQWLYQLYQLYMPDSIDRHTPEELLDNTMCVDEEDAVAFILFLFDENEPDRPVMFQNAWLLPRYDPEIHRLTFVFCQPGQVLDMSRISEKDAETLKEYGWGYLAAVMEMAYNRIDPVGIMPDTLVNYVPTLMERLLSEATTRYKEPATLQLHYYDPVKHADTVDPKHMYVFYRVVIQSGPGPGWCLYGLCLHSDVDTALRRIRGHLFGKQYRVTHYDHKRTKQVTTQHVATTLLQLVRPEDSRVCLQ